MTATTETTASALQAGEKGSEAEAQITSSLRAARSKVPAELLAVHLRALYGDDGFVILRAAAEATLRRLQIVKQEGLRVQRRPAAGFCGDYQTARRGKRQRPYRTRLYRVEPLQGSCDCPDFRSNSLGLCKHLLAVLEDLCRRPGVLARARALDPTCTNTPELRWRGKKPLCGDGDWLRQVVLLWPGPVRLEAWSSLRRRFREVGGALVLEKTHAGDPTARLLLLDALWAAMQRTPRRTAADPALSACILDERHRLETAITLQPARRELTQLRGFHRTLYAYQREGVARFLASGRLLLADDMGLGKTTQAVAAAFVLFRQGLVQRGLLVVPASLKHQWLREWQACCDLPLVLVDGPPEARARCYRSTKRGFLVANYEQLLRDLELVQRWRPDLVLLDEAQRIKNWETRTAATIKQLDPQFRLVLTGTPFENRVLELDSILEWLDRRPLQPLWRLLPFHQMDDGAGLRHLDVLRKRLSTVLLRRRRQEVLDQLPARTDTRIDMPMTPAQRDEHDARLQPIAQLLAISARRPLTQSEFLRLMVLFTEQRIVANGMAQFAFDEVWPGIHKARPEPALLDGLSMPKLAELRLLVQQVAVAQGRKLVVFSQWRRALQLVAWAIGGSLATAGVRCAFFTGAESLRRRNENIVAFHDDPATRVLLATDAGGIGLNLQKAASCCVHFDLPWNPAVFEQRVGRIWRLGQTSKVDVYSLVSEDCIESRMSEILKTKQATFSALFDGHSDEVKFDGQVGFLAAARSVAAATAVEVGRVRAAVTPRAEEPEGEDDAELGNAPSRTGSVPGRAMVAPSEQVAVTAVADEAIDPRPRLDKRTVRSLLAGLTVQPRPDGGMVLEADRESAAVLAEVLRGLAGAIEGAVGGDA